jgi:hypothetical protein
MGTVRPPTDAKPSSGVRHSEEAGDDEEEGAESGECAAVVGEYEGGREEIADEGIVMCG